MITLKTMAAVQTILDAGSVAAATQRLGLAQSVVSAHFLNFQQWFDYPVFKSGRPAGVPTPAGEEAVRRMRTVLQRHADLTAFARGASHVASPSHAFDADSITLKQLETFHWLMKLGSVVSAANKINITQAAASRRIQELAARCREPVFSNPRDKNHLTPFGRQLLRSGELVLDAYSDLKACRSKALAPQILHIGITELVALTWFPTFVRRLRTTLPHVVIHPDVDISTSLQEKLLASQLDIALIPEPSLAAAMDHVEIGSTTFSWFCAPGTFGNRKRASLSELASRPLLVQGRESGLTPVAQKLFASAGLTPREIFGSNSLVALAGLIESGIGVSCLPSSLFADWVKQGRLQVISSATPPKANYYLAWLKRHPNSLYAVVADIARDTCRF